MLGRHGHLSNEDCAALVERLLHDQLKKIYLAHLSEECNAPEAALATVRRVLGDYKIDLSIAHQNQISSPTYFNTEYSLVETSKREL